MTDKKRKRIKNFLWKLRLTLGEPVFIDCDTLGDLVTFYTKDKIFHYRYSWFTFDPNDKLSVEYFCGELRSEGIPKFKRFFYRLRQTRISFSTSYHKSFDPLVYRSHWWKNFTIWLKVNGKTKKVFNFYRGFSTNRRYMSKREDIMKPWKLDHLSVTFFNAKRDLFSYRKVYYMNKGWPTIRVFNLNK